MLPTAWKSFCTCCLALWLTWGIPTVHGTSSLSWLDSHKTTGADMDDGDRFGTSVAIDDDFVVVGAPRHSSLGNDAGAAYVFDIATGSEVLKLQAFDLPPYNQYADDRFGHAVAIDQEKILVSSPWDDQHGNDAGAIYAFDAESGIQNQKLIHSSLTGGEQFGHSVAISGNTAVVGALATSNAYDVPGVGGAYVFTYNPVAEYWLEGSKLNIDGLGDLYGWSVDVSGTTAIVGGRDAVGNSGSAYLFDTITGNEIMELSAASSGVTGLGDVGGSDVAISGDYAIVGSTVKQEVYVYERVGGIWSSSPSQTLTASDNASGDAFGWSIDLEGRIAVVSAHGDDDKGVNSGSVYFFDVSTGLELDKITAFDGGSFDAFGSAVALDETHAVVGANFDLVSGDESGSAYLFSLPADFDNDDDVDEHDLAIWHANWGATGATHAMGDANLDGIVNGADFLLWQRQEAVALATGATQVPEPTAASLLLLATFLWSLSSTRNLARNA